MWLCVNTVTNQDERDKVTDVTKQPQKQKKNKKKNKQGQNEQNGGQKNRKKYTPNNREKAKKRKFNYDSDNTTPVQNPAKRRKTDDFYYGKMINHNYQDLSVKGNQYGPTNGCYGSAEKKGNKKKKGQGRQQQQGKAVNSNRGFKTGDKYFNNQTPNSFDWKKFLTPVTSNGKKKKKRKRNKNGEQYL